MALYVDIFILQMILLLHLNVQNNNDNLSANVTLVTNTCMFAVIHFDVFYSKFVGGYTCR